MGSARGLEATARHVGFFIEPGRVDEFFRVGFSHHSEILAKEKSLQGRLFYIAQCAAEFWTVEALKSNLRGDLYSKKGALLSNFLMTLPDAEQARRVIRFFKDEYMLDFINIACTRRYGGRQYLSIAGAFSSIRGGKAPKIVP